MTGTPPDRPPSVAGVTIDAASLARLESALTDPSMTPHIDSVIVRTPDGFRAASANGSIDFREGEDGEVDVLDERGAHPLRNVASSPIAR